jgi:phosphoadenosine phosphosulfate reductase
VRKIEQVDGKLKLSPLADWSGEQVSAYVRQHDVPMHPLYAAGYRSIGCAPCTRAVQEGEGERAGRWWWEQDDKKECGLHSRPPGSR